MSIQSRSDHAPSASESRGELSTGAPPSMLQSAMPGASPAMIQRKVARRALQRQATSGGEAGHHKIPEGAVTSDDLKGYANDEAATAFEKKIFDKQQQYALGAQGKLVGKDREPNFTRGLKDDELGTVEGPYKMRKDAAEACKKLLSAARAAKPKDVSIGVVSAYRSPEYDMKVWEDQNVKVIIRKTQAERAKLAGGQYGDAAVDLVLAQLQPAAVGKEGAPIKRVPNFSTHNSGVAVDFSSHEKIDGKEVDLGAQKSQTGEWKKSWFWKWLGAHAHGFGFEPLSSEPWHWDFHAK